MRILIKINKWIGALLIIAIASTLSIFLYDFYSIVTKSTKKEVENNMMQSTQISANMIHEKVKSDLNTVYTLSNVFSEYKKIDSPEAKLFLKKLGNELPFSIIVVSSIDGTYYTNTGGTINLSEPNYLVGATGKKKTISVIYQNVLYGKDMIALESPIYQNNKRIGKISGLYYANYINNILNKVADDYGHQYQIVDRNGDFVLSSEASVFQDYKNIYNFLDNVTFNRGYRKEFFIQDFINGTPGISAYSSHSKTSFLCYIPIGFNDWYLITVVPNLSINLQISMQNPTVLLAIRIVVLFILLMLYIVWRQMRYRITMEKNKNELEILNARLKIKNETLKLKAENDLLTGIYNKITSERLISNYLKNEGKKGRHALCVIDIDDFKNINDEMGHYFGDNALTEVANVIDHCLRTTDIKGRIGGDEFIILLKNIKSDEDLKWKSAEICSKIKDIKVADSPAYKLSGSIGISIYPDHARTYTDLFLKADKAMYYSKEQGKGIYSIYSRILEN